MSQKIFIAFGLHLRINNPEAFAAAAREMAIGDGYTVEEANENYTVNNLASCAQMLFDPGVSPAGCEIIQSVGEVLS